MQAWVCGLGYRSVSSTWDMRDTAVSVNDDVVKSLVRRVCGGLAPVEWEAGRGGCDESEYVMTQRLDHVLLFLHGQS